MDKDTINAYTMIIVATIVMSVMIAFATPFGTYIGDSVANIIKGGANVAAATVDTDNFDKQVSEYNDMFNNGENAITYCEAGLYKSATDYEEMKTNWDKLISDKILRNTNGSVATVNNSIVRKKVISNGVESIVIENSGAENTASNRLDGDLCIKSNATKVLEYGFFNCVLLENVNLKSIQVIGEYAFAGCSNLKTVILNADYITEIGDYAFQNCNLLTTIYYSGTSEQFRNIKTGNAISPNLITVICKNETISI